MARATEILCEEHGVSHVDLNFGCPVPKVTRKGGGAALPWKRDRLREILTETVRETSPRLPAWWKGKCWKTRKLGYVCADSSH